MNDDFFFLGGGGGAVTVLRNMCIYSDEQAGVHTRVCVSVCLCIGARDGRTNLTFFLLAVVLHTCCELSNCNVNFLNGTFLLIALVILLF